MHTLVTNETGFFFDSSTDKQIKTESHSKTSQTDNTDKHQYCCKSCAIFIVKQINAIQFEGRHEHQHTNPQGQRFDFRCFDMAPGCGSDGPLTFEATWFSNFQWRISYCKSCKTQLGWQFIGSSRFYGLIDERMMLCRKLLDDH